MSDGEDKKIVQIYEKPKQRKMFKPITNYCILAAYFRSGEPVNGRTVYPREQPPTNENERNNDKSAVDEANTSELFHVKEKMNEYEACVLYRNQMGFW
ncbi:unnamed protein product [Macrosiphum euphorbiae]|uniref:Uncharacterized protein n=1 Tax=Macrosiphum euphorbiae TaxID=13131 RepID=A0AAV0VT02_9HEMI|nr:unnamed protein product [Macrosiphum euphorbiae]